MKDPIREFTTEFQRHCHIKVWDWCYRTYRLSTWTAAMRDYDFLVVPKAHHIEVTPAPLQESYNLPWWGDPNQDEHAAATTAAETAEFIESLLVDNY